MMGHRIRSTRYASLTLALGLTVSGFASAAATPLSAPQPTLSSSVVSASAKQSLLFLDINRVLTAKGAQVPIAITLGAVPAQGYLDAIPGTNTVVLQRRLPGSKTWTTVATYRIGKSQQVTATLRPTRSASYRAVFAGKPGFTPALSAIVAVAISPGRASVLYTRANPENGVLYGQLRRASDRVPLANRKVQLFSVNANGQRTLVATRTTNKDGVAAFPGRTPTTDLSFHYLMQFPGDRVYAGSGWADCAGLCGE